LGLLSCFAALGLKGLSVYRNKRVSVDIAAGERQLLRFTFSDVILLFAALAAVTLDGTSVEFLRWTVEQLKSGPKVASVIVWAAYTTALICAIGYAFGTAVVLALNLVRDLIRSATGAKK
jgi:hypothetical protein